MLGASWSSLCRNLSYEKHFPTQGRGSMCCSECSNDVTKDSSEHVHTEKHLDLCRQCGTIHSFREFFLKTKLKKECTWIGRDINRDKYVCVYVCYIFDYQTRNVRDVYILYPACVILLILVKNKFFPRVSVVHGRYLRCALARVR